MKKLLIPALALGLMSAPAIASEHNNHEDCPDSPYYMTLELGTQKSIFTDVKNSDTDAFPIDSRAVDSRHSANFFSVGVGYDWKGSPWRTELSYKKVGKQTFADQQVFFGMFAEETEVDVKQELLMLEMLYDFDIADSKIKPYVGAGIGLSKTRVSAYQTDVPAAPGRSASFASHGDTNFAWSLSAGADYPITKNIDLGVGYRYTDAGNVSTDNNCAGTDPWICYANEKHSADLKSHSLFLKTSYRF